MKFVKKFLAYEDNLVYYTSNPRQMRSVAGL